MTTTQIPACQRALWLTRTPHQQAGTLQSWKSSGLSRQISYVSVGVMVIATAAPRHIESL